MTRFLVIGLIILAAMSMALLYNSNSSFSQPRVIVDLLKVGDTEESVRHNLARYKISEVERVQANQEHKGSLILEVSNYETLGCEGKLSLQFYNGELFDVWFYPENPQAYLSELKKVGLDLLQQKEIYRNGFKIWAMNDGKSQFYVGRRDQAIGEQNDDDLNR